MTEDPVPIVRCHLCQQIVAIDLGLDGWTDKDLNRKIARHISDTHPQEQR